MTDNEKKLKAVAGAFTGITVKELQEKLRPRYEMRNYLGLKATIAGLEQSLSKSEYTIKSIRESIADVKERLRADLNAKVLNPHDRSRFPNQPAVVALHEKLQCLEEAERTLAEDTRRLAEAKAEEPKTLQVCRKGCPEWAAALDAEATAEEELRKLLHESP